MEGIWRWRAITILAPIIWGSTYFVTRQWLPADQPLWGAAIRALPAGLILLVIARALPRGQWWWRSIVLGSLNAGLFFALIYVAAQLLPTSIASVVMAASPLAMMALSAALLNQSMTAKSVLGGVLGLAGVVVMLAGDSSAINPIGVLIALIAMLMSSVGFVLTSRWGDEVPVLAATSWQLVGGGLVVLVLAVLLEGPPPQLSSGALLGFAYLTVVATAVAYLAWFFGLRHLGPTDVGLLGLMNPVTGVLLGTLVAGEHLELRQLGGMVVLLVGVVVGQRAGSASTQRHRIEPIDPDPRPVALLDRVGGGEVTAGAEELAEEARKQPVA